jgi:hypothetical protein
MGGVALVGAAVTLFSVSGFEVPTLPVPPRALGAQAATLQKKLHALEAEHAQAVERWMELDARKDA